MNLADKKTENPWFPSRDEVLSFIRDNPDRASKRDIAKAFGVRGSDRIPLKKMLKDLEEDGLINSRRKRYSEAGDLPPVFVASIFEVDEDGDLLAEPAKWTDETKPPPRILVRTSSRDRAKAGPGDAVLIEITERGSGTEKKPGYVAKIIKVLPKRPTAVLGVVQFARHADALPRLLPVDRKQAEIEIEELKGARDGELVEVALTKVGRYGLQRARVLECLGSIKGEKAISAIAIHEHEIPHIFPGEVLEEAEAAKNLDFLDNRQDWRDIPFVTIDPADAKDHDDAVFAKPDDDPANEGGHILDVAIADVAHYVRKGSCLDREAQVRGNSVYFPDRVVPMLPETISNNLCSLKEGEDRPALVARIWLNRNGRKLKHRFFRITMRSRASLSYEEAQAAVDGNPSERALPLLDATIRPLWDAYRTLLNERGEREPLDLNVIERKLRLNAEGRVQDVIVAKRLTAHKLIEEFMILANVAAAEMLEEKRSPLIFRVHDAPSLAKLEALRDFLSTIELKLPKAGNIRPSHFNSLLSMVKGENHELLTHQVILRSQAQAEYSPENYGHFGLNLQKYAHFTSPIRRYSDLIVHRALITALELGKGGLAETSLEDLHQISKHISTTERRAMAAERTTVDRLIAEWLSDKVGSAFHGRIGGVTKSGLFITLDDTGADGFIPISTLGKDYYHFDEARHALVGERTGLTFQMGDRVEVELVEALPFAGALRFSMLSEGRKGKAGLRALPKRGKAKRQGADAARRNGPPKGVSRKIKRRR